MRIRFDARLVLVAGIVLFVAAKALFIWSQTAAMGMPRLGDDAYSHLWYAKAIDDIGIAAAFRGHRGSGFRATRDIVAFCGADAPALPQERARCARLASSATGPDVKFGASLLLNGILRLGLPPKWSYAIYETAIMAAIAASFAWFLFKVVGPAAAGVALAFLSFMVLIPPQGLHQFVPSTLVIGLSLALWGAVMGSVSWRRYAAAGIGFVVLSRFHPVALVYAAGLPVIAACAWRGSLNAKLVGGAALAAAVALAILIWIAEPVRDVIRNALNADVSAVFLENLRDLPAGMAAFAVGNWALVAAFLVSMAFWGRTLDRRALAAGIALLALAACALFYRLESHILRIPIDLFARVFVGFAVLCCGILAKVLVEVVWGDPAWRRAAVVACVLLLPVPSAVRLGHILFSNVNGRMEVVDDALLAKTVAGFDRDATLGYGELEIPATALLLAGAGHLGAIPLRALSAETLKGALMERRPAAVVFPNFPFLNSLASVDSRSLERRRHGLAAAVVDLLHVSAREPIRAIFLKVENDGAEAATIAPIAYDSDGQALRKPQDVVVPPGVSGWVIVEVAGPRAARALSLRLPASPLWVLGIAINERPQAGVNWPWQSEATVEWHARDRPPGAVARIVFSVPELFRFWNTPGLELIPLDRPGSVMSDESGIVFVATGYRAAR